jgi:hypothetical protein
MTEPEEHTAVLFEVLVGTALGIFLGSTADRLVLGWGGSCTQED